MTTLNEKIDQYKILKNKIDELTEQLNAVKAEIIEDMNGEDIVKTDKYTVKYSLISSNRFDTTRFKKANPDMYSEFVVESQSRRFTVL